MAKNTKKRTQVKNLPQPEQELTAKAAKKVKGGLGGLRRSALSAQSAQPLETFAVSGSTGFESTVASGGEIVEGSAEVGSAAGASSVAGGSG